MGWINEGADDHEGWVANVLTDGRVAAASTSTGVIVHELLAADIAAAREVRRYEGTDHLDVIVPWDQVAYWQVTCQCGWTGEQIPAHDDPHYGTRDCPEDIEDRILRPLWAEHLAPHTALSELGELMTQARDLDQRLTEKVTLARTAGASWTHIGRATGLSRQGAQQRWAHLTASSTE